MTRRQRLFAKAYVALAAHKTRVGLSLINLIIQHPTLVSSRRDVAAFSAAAGPHPDLERRGFVCLHRIHVVTGKATNVWMIPTFMPVSAGREAVTPEA